MAVPRSGFVPHQFRLGCEQAGEAIEVVSVQPVEPLAGGAVDVRHARLTFWVDLGCR
jgi:hypothetical protein